MTTMKPICGSIRRLRDMRTENFDCGRANDMRVVSVFSARIPGKLALSAVAQWNAGVFSINAVPPSISHTVSRLVSNEECPAS